MIDQKEKKRVIITGGSGFIGSHLISFLKTKSEFDITSIDISGCKEEMNCFQFDYSDRDELSELLKEGDTVIHLACASVPLTSEEDWQRDLNDNLEGVESMLDVGHQKKIDRIIFMSSGGTVYGDHGNILINENCQTNPIGYHGRMKLAVEKKIIDYSLNKGVKFVILRASNPYGRKLIQGRKTQGIIELVLSSLKNDQEIELWGDGNQVRDFIYIEDLVSAVYGIIKSKIRNEIINIGSGNGISLSDLFLLIEKETGKKINTKKIPAKKFDIKYNVLDISKINKALGWSPKTDIANGLRVLIKDYGL